MQKKIHPIDMFAGEKLRQARLTLGLSQDSVAKQLMHPITFQQIQKYERGSNRLSASKLWEFAEVLRVPPEFFFPTSDHTCMLCENPPEVHLLQIFRTLSKARQNALLLLMESE